MKKVVKISLIVIIIGAFIGTFFYLYKQSKEEPTIFKTKEPFYTDIVKKTVATGEVVPRKEIEIKPQVSGIIHKLYVEPGNQVEEGDLIARVKIIPNMVELNRAQSRVKKAKISYEDEQKYKKVYPELGISDGINIEVKSGISKNTEIKDPTRRETKNKES